MNHAISPPIMMNLLINHYLVGLGLAGTTLGVVVIKASNWIQQLDPSVGFMIKLGTLAVITLTIIKMSKEIFFSKKKETDSVKSEDSG